MASQNPFTTFSTSEDRFILARKIVQGISDFNPSDCPKIALTLALNPSLMDDLTVKESRLILELAKQCSEVPWKLPESTVHNPDQFAPPSHALAEPRTTLCYLASRLFLNSHFDDCSTFKSVVVPKGESVPSNRPCVSVDFAAVSARVLSTQSILTSLKSTVVQMEKVLFEDKKLLQSFEADDVDSDSAPTR
nr:uncharacterized protein LOC109146977 [Ipomoea trifida]